MSTPIKQADIPGLSLFRRGKVRDVYEVDGHLLIVATDRVSAFDVVLPTPIPNKGRVLTALSIFWFDFLKSTVRSHLITADADRYPAALVPWKDMVSGRSMLVLRADVVPFECVARGYLSGSGWREYQQTGQVCGIRLPSNLKESDRLPEPIFTPATKAETGHDINVDEAYMSDKVGADLTRRLKELTLTIYRTAAEYAAGRGIIIADTKFEFGLYGGEVILVDEVLTPDSSRFWPKEQFQPGRGQPSFDKQFVRDYLETLTWDKRPPGPDLPPDVVAKTSEKYLEAYRLLTGNALADC
ncbi:MAG TPA: phosphoribosylaminoimidazolesuccinocarboxamide synthase [Blastocatellia bacterium]|nr:phosphoribosylaminoimidazolesuccinocarboxamide synthase [Blastocatellia bacterium]